MPSMLMQEPNTITEGSGLAHIQYKQRSVALTCGICLADPLL